jgi:hypothetical protein
MNLPVVNACDGCNVCCTVLGVPELDKSAGTRCMHETPAGCGRYDTRPGSCREYNCLFLNGLIPVRPDKLGLIFDSTGEGGELERVTGIRPLVAREVRPGAADTAEAQQVLRQVADRLSIILIRGATDNRSLFGPPDQIAKIQKWMEAKRIGFTNRVVPSETPFALPKVGRNESCPCGSGRKFKKCHGAG